MKRILNGKTYNTHTSELVCEHDVYSNGNWIGSKDLYCTKSGVYFFVVQGNQREIWAPKDSMEVITMEEAKEYCEEFGNPDDYIKQFGEPEEA